MLPISRKRRLEARDGDGDVNEASSPGQLAKALGHSPTARPASAGFAEAIGSIPAVCNQRGSRTRRAPVECGDLPFLIRRDGTWLYRGSPIARKELVCLFASVLKREADGSFWLETPAERGHIEVEDAPFVAVELDWRGDGRQQSLSFRTNIDEVVTAGPDHPIRVAHDILTCEPTPYILVRPGTAEPGIEARINRPVYYELVALAVPEWVGCRRMLGVWSCGRFFPLGELPPGEG
jgi:uncharacterized protein